jgi:uncharacterized repeat protein (TIGR03943 family)
MRRSADVDARLGRVLALAVWSALFAALWATDRTAHYLGPKTSWVVPFGAVLTGAAAVVLAFRGRSGTALARREAWGLAVVLAPVVAVLAAPHAQLGAAAAERRATLSSPAGRPIGARPSAGHLVAPHGPVLEGTAMFAYIMAAQGPVPQPGTEPGVRVRLVGFAMRPPGTPSGLFQVARFTINCCVADASVVSVTVDPVSRAVPARDSWVVVGGSLQRLGSALVLRADSIREVQPPAHPYLSGGRPLNVVPTRHGTRPPSVPGA